MTHRLTILGYAAWTLVMGSSLQAAPVYVKCVSSGLPYERQTEIFSIDDEDFARWDETKWIPLGDFPEEKCNHPSDNKANNLCKITPTEFEFVSYGFIRSQEFWRILIDRLSGEYQTWRMGKPELVGSCTATQPPQPRVRKF